MRLTIIVTDITIPVKSSRAAVASRPATLTTRFSDEQRKWLEDAVAHVLGRKSQMGFIANEVRQRRWPKYDAAVIGFRNYWYPAFLSRGIGRKPITLKLLGEQVMFVRDQGKVYAFQDKCPHRGIPLSVGRREFPGTWTCRYHGWTFDVKTGVLKAALTDGPESPICGKVGIPTYPVEERAGLVWVYMGDGPPPPVESDIPEAFLHPDSVIMSRITERPGNWRYGAENGFDEAHAKYLHRYGALWTMFRQMPAWTEVKISQNGPWLTREKRPGQVAFQSDYPGLGKWPKLHFWNKLIASGGGALAIRLPGLLVSQYPTHAHYEWYVATDSQHYRYLQFLVTRASGLKALAYRLRYWLYRRWLFHVLFNNQDGWMVRLMPETSPDRFFRPDASITAWRLLCEHARGEADAQTPLERQLEEIHAELETVGRE